MTKAELSLPAVRKMYDTAKAALGYDLERVSDPQQSRLG